jgi:hypothetical protein
MSSPFSFSQRLYALLLHTLMTENSRRIPFYAFHEGYYRFIYSIFKVAYYIFLRSLTAALSALLLLLQRCRVCEELERNGNVSFIPCSPSTVQAKQKLEDKTS